MVELRSTIKRGRRYYGYAGLVPGLLAIIFLIFLPGFAGFFNAVRGPGMMPEAPGGYESVGRLVAPFAIGGGLIGGLLGGILGLLAGWALLGRRFRIIIVSLLCLPVIFGETAAASAFFSTIGVAVERAVPLNGFITLILFECWRITGPVALVATLVMERKPRVTATDPLPPGQVALATWIRWRVLLVVAVMSGILAAIMGAGHMQLGSGVAKLIPGPADPAWLHPTLRAALAWIAFNWPVYIGAVLILMGLVFRVPSRTVELE